MMEPKTDKKEQLRAKVQALVSCYEQEKRRNEELQMELERLKSEQRNPQLDGLQQQRDPAPLPPEAPPQLMYTGRLPQPLPQQPYAAPQQRPQPYGAYPYGPQLNPYEISLPPQGYYGQPSQTGAGNLMISIGQAQQAITQVCMKLQQAGNYRDISYGGCQQQHSCLDQEAIHLLSLLNALYNQLGDLNCELATHQSGAAPFVGN